MGDTKQKAPGNKTWNFCSCNDFVVDLARENWNCLFEDLVVFCERLEELDIESIIKKMDIS